MSKLPPYILTDPRSGRHLYKRGWLGLIPLVGAFVGIGLMTLGLVRYKDKKLVMIGIAAILFTVILYGSIFYYVEYSYAGRKQFADTSQDILNNLVKSIEFYKLQNGQYPDSLEQISELDKFTFIYDPLSLNSKFQYKKINNNYKLFSAGIDKIVNTADDIYPSLDTDRTGFLLPNQK